MRGPRTQAERDAQTVEIGFALLTALVLAGLCFLAFIGILALIDGLEPLSPSAAHTLLMLAGSTSATVFVGRVLYVLMRAPSGRLAHDTADEDGAELPDPMGEYVEGAAGTNGRKDAGAAGPQPSQPGRTSPDS
jgi:membrane protein implicated in regulation of membrane protease activity